MIVPIINRGLGLLDKIVQWVCVILLATLAGSVTWQVLSRYVTAKSAPWTGEVATICFVWLAMLAIALGVRRGRHMVMDLWEYLGENSAVAKVIRVFAALAVVAILLVLTWVGTQGLDAAFARRLPMLGISYGWQNLAVPVGAGLALLFAVEATIRTALAKGNENPLSQEVLYDDDLGTTDMDRTM